MDRIQPAIYAAFIPWESRIQDESKDESKTGRPRVSVNSFPVVYSISSLYQVYIKPISSLYELTLDIELIESRSRVDIRRVGVRREIPKWI
jgi:hypothetical protein